MLFLNRKKTPSSFDLHLAAKFGEESVQEVKTFLNDVQLPIPKRISEYFLGRTGVLLLVSRYGVIVRLECNDDDENFITRINDHDFILKPLATRHLGRVTAEICPGYHLGADEDDVSFVVKQLKNDGISFFDALPNNVGFSPFKTPEFPKGRPTLIDRISVSRLNAATAEIKQALAERIPTVEDTAYAPLVSALREAWSDAARKPDAEKIGQFWSLCTEFKKEGKLVTGWTNPTHFTPARGIAEGYDRKFFTNPVLKKLARSLGF